MISRTVCSGHPAARNRRTYSFNSSACRSFHDAFDGSCTTTTAPAALSPAFVEVGLALFAATMAFVVVPVAISGFAPVLSHQLASNTFAASERVRIQTVFFMAALLVVLRGDVSHPPAPVAR